MGTDATNEMTISLVSLLTVASKKVPEHDYETRPYEASRMLS